MLDARTILACLALLGSHATAAEIYQSIDAQGNIVYSDRPDSPEQLPMITTAGRIRTAYPVDVADAPNAATTPDQEDAADPNPMVPLCERAKEIRDTYEASSYLAEKDDDGSERILSDEEMRLAIIRARQDVEKFCGDDP